MYLGLALTTLTLSIVVVRAYDHCYLLAGSGVQGGAD